MRNLLTISLLALYAVTSLGIQGVSHFCGDELVGISFFEELDCESNACCSIPEDDPECCTDLEFSVFYESERTFANFLYRSVINLPIQPRSFVYFPDLFTTRSLESQAFQPNEHLTVETAPFYITHQSLIFYG